MKGYTIFCCCCHALPQMSPKAGTKESSQSPRFAWSSQDFSAGEREGRRRCLQSSEIQLLPQVYLAALEVKASTIIKINPFDSIKPTSECQSSQTVGNVIS